MNKSDIRKEYLAKREALSQDEFGAANQSLINNLFTQFDFSPFKCLHTFLSIDKFKEVNTWAIIDRLQTQFPQLKIVVPKMIGNELEHYEYQGENHLETNSWGIKEPINSPKVQKEDIDCVLVPLLAFDHYGHRVGYGKGFYDRFLPKAQQATTIGLSLFPSIEDQLETNTHDIPLQYCVTPKKIYQFKV